MKLLKLFTICLFIALMVVSVSAVSVSPSKYELEYEPGLKKTLEFIVRPNLKEPSIVGFGIEGALSEYITVPEETVRLNPGESKSVFIEINLPQEDIGLMGMQRTYIYISERAVAGNDAQIGAVATVAPDIRVYFPFPGKYVDVLSVNVPSVNQGESIELKYKIKGLGGLTTTADMSVEIRDSFNQVVLTQNLGTKTVDPEEERIITETINTSQLDPGRYDVRVSATFDGGVTSGQALFFIGEEKVELVSIKPNKFFFNSVSQVEISLSNLWNGEYSNVYAEIEYANRTAITSSGKLRALSSLELKQFIDLQGVEPGLYNGTVTVYFGGNQQEFTFEAKLLNEKETKIVKGESVGLELTQILIIVSVVLVIAAIMLAIFFLKHERRANKKKK